MMANTSGVQTSGANEVVGKVFILYGKVKAISPDGTVRILTVNSPVFAFDRIVTEDDGTVSILLEGPPPVHLDIGRMSDIVIDEDVFQPVTPGEIAEATAEVEEIQQALLEGEGDIELEPTAAGGETDSGGGHPTVVFEPTGDEVVPESGAETIGLGPGETVEPLEGEGGTEEPAPYIATVTLEAGGDVYEGGQIIYTATVDNPPAGSPLVITLTNGSTLEIPVGETTGSTTIDAPSDDPYIDAGPVFAAIENTDGGGYDDVVYDTTPTETLIQDTIDTTTVSMAAGDVDEDTDGVTFTATLSNPGETDVTIATDLGDITIPAGQTTGTLFVSTADPDVYIDPDTITATVSEVTGGNFEAVDFSAATATAQITDTIDTTTVSLSVEDVDENAEGVTFTANLSNPGETD
ncbi:MAG: retention module-containing protein, partial [Desulfatiglandaceae bacterium]